MRFLSDSEIVAIVGDVHVEEAVVIECSHVDPTTFVVWRTSDNFSLVAALSDTSGSGIAYADEVFNLGDVVISSSKVL
jgi:hypothetical protein